MTLNPKDPPVNSYTITIAPNDDSGHTTTLVVDTSGDEVLITDVHLRAPGGLAGGQMPTVDFSLLLRAIATPAAPAQIAATPVENPVVAEPEVSDTSDASPTAPTQSPTTPSSSADADEEQDTAPGGTEGTTSTAAGDTTPTATGDTAAAAAGDTAPTAPAAAVVPKPRRRPRTTPAAAEPEAAPAPAPAPAPRERGRRTPKAGTTPRAARTKAAATTTKAAATTKAATTKAASTKAASTKAGSTTAGKAARNASAKKTAVGGSGGRVYRRMPEDLPTVYRQTGSTAAIADHYGVPRHTAQGWLRRIRGTAAQATPTTED